MKRFFAVFLILVLVLPVSSFADLPDISALTYDELTQLKDKINLAMWNSQEWQEVTVPVGVWTIGEDIPAAHWSISLSSDASAKWAGLKYCDLLDASGLDAGNMFDCNIYAYLTVGAESNDRYSSSVDIDLKPGTYLIVSNAPVVFTPYTGKPELGFK